MKELVEDIEAGQRRLEAQERILEATRGGEPSLFKEVVVPAVVGTAVTGAAGVVAATAGPVVGAAATVVHAGLKVKEAWDIGQGVGAILTSEELVNDFATALYVHQDALQNGTFSLDQAFSGQEFTLPLLPRARYIRGGGGGNRRQALNALFSGGVNFSRFDDRSGATTSDGHSTTYNVGLDVLPNPEVPLMTGLHLAYTRVNADFREAEFDGEGAYDVKLFTVSPHVAWDATDKLTLWSSIGWGRGETSVTIDTVADIRVDALESASATDTGDFFQVGAGANLRVWEGDASALSLQVGGATASFLGADSKQGRVAAQFSHDFALSSGRLKSSANLAWLLSDADPGAMELSGALNWLPSQGRLSGTTVARVLLFGEDRSEWGISGDLVLRPGQEGEGLSLSLQPSFGQATASLAGLESPAAWDRYNDLARGLALDTEPLTARFHAEVAYGFRKGNSLWKPYTQLDMTEYSTVYGAGLRYALDDSLDLDLNASHRNRSSGSNDNRVFLQLRTDL